MLSGIKTKMKVLVLSVLLCLAVFAKADFESYEEYSPEEENFALGVDAKGEALDELAADEGTTTKLGPMQQCLWDWLQCSVPGKKNSSRCGWAYRECIDKAKGKPEPPPPVPPTET